MHDLPVSVNDRVIAGNREDFIFTKLKPSPKFPNLQYAKVDKIQKPLMDSSMVFKD